MSGEVGRILASDGAANIYMMKNGELDVDATLEKLIAARSGGIKKKQAKNFLQTQKRNIDKARKEQATVSTPGQRLWVTLHPGDMLRHHSINHRSFQQMLMYLLAPFSKESGLVDWCFGRPLYVLRGVAVMFVEGVSGATLDTLEIPIVKDNLMAMEVTKQTQLEGVWPTDRPQSFWSSIDIHPIVTEDPPRTMATMYYDSLMTKAVKVSHPKRRDAKLSDYLLDPADRARHDYPPQSDESHAAAVRTLDEYCHAAGTRSPDAPLVGLDCEMVMTTEGSQLARVAMVDGKGAVLLDQLVLPAASVTDYLTQYSGITAELLSGVTTSLSEAQTLVLGVLDSIAAKVGTLPVLVGHSLENDFTALEMDWPLVFDTAVVFGQGQNRKPKLSKLAAEKLKRAVQGDSAGHSPEEDAVAAVDLAKFAMAKQLPDHRLPTRVHTAWPTVFESEHVKSHPVTFRAFSNRPEYVDSGIVGEGVGRLTGGDGETVAAAVEALKTSQSVPGLYKECIVAAVTPPDAAALSAGLTAVVDAAPPGFVVVVYAVPKPDSEGRLDWRDAGRMLVATKHV